MSNLVYPGGTGITTVVNTDLESSDMTLMGTSIAGAAQQTDYSDVKAGIVGNPGALGGVTAATSLDVSGNITMNKASGTAIKIDTASPDFGWHDMIGTVSNRGTGGTQPGFNIWQGNIRAFEFAVNDEVWVDFHMPHDYAPGTDLFLHTHWTHDSTLVTGGSITVGYDITYAKGHQQAAFPATVNTTILQNANTTQYYHMIAEVQISATSPSASQLDTDDLEIDGLILVRVYLSANAITSSGAVPDPFFHFTDVHYQSTQLPTKNKAPDFYA